MKEQTRHSSNLSIEKELRKAQKTFLKFLHKDIQLLVQIKHDKAHLGSWSKSNMIRATYKRQTLKRGISYGLFTYIFKL